MLNLMGFYGLSSILPFFSFLLPLALVVYLIIRWKSYRENQMLDPELGIKTVIYYLKTLSYQLLLAAGSILLVGLLQELESLSRTGGALLCSGTIVFIATSALLHYKTNTVEFPQVKIFYMGFNMLLTGIIAIISLSVIFIVLFNKYSNFSNVKTSMSIFLVYAGALGTQLFYFFKQSKVRVS